MRANMPGAPALNDSQSPPLLARTAAPVARRVLSPRAIPPVILPQPAVVPPPAGYPQISVGLGTCHRCGRVMTPNVREVERVIGAVGVPVGRNAVIVPNRQVQFAAECPFCGAPLHVPQVEEMNQRLKNDQVVGGLILLGIIAVIVLVFAVLCAWIGTWG